jgi:dTDP-4-amino-4,6-dideoxygalactose transaminase
LDSLQAAALRAKLKRLDRWNLLRRKIAALYNNELSGVRGIIVPHEESYARHIYHSYALRLECRDRLNSLLLKQGVGTAIYYPIPLHLQKAYKSLKYRKADFPVSNKVSSEILSLPIYPHLKESEIKYITGLIRSALS